MSFWEPATIDYDNRLFFDARLPHRSATAALRMDHYQQKLFDRINYERQVKNGTGHFKLDNMAELLRRLGDPHLKYPVIHVAGTKGKGSVSTMIGNILTTAGNKTGVYTSPHLETLHQRIAIDGVSISNDQLESVLAQLDPHIEQLDKDANADPSGDAKPPTFFEIVTAAAVLHFAQQQCQAVVLEVGLGGRLDSTNVCQPDVCVITNISLDHTRQLGDTVEKIAAEKAGIIKPGIPVISGVLDPAAAEVIQEIASQRDAPLLQLEKDFRIQRQLDGPQEHHPESRSEGNRLDDRTAFDYLGVMESPNPLAFPFAEHPLQVHDIRLRLLGAHQRTNAALAIAAIQVLQQKGWQISPAQIGEALAHTTLAGRTEVAHQNPTILLDIAHNQASIEALVQTLQLEFPGWHQAARRVLIFGTSKDKDAPTMLASLAPHFDEVIVTKYQLNPRGRSTASLVKMIEQISPNSKIKVQPTPRDAWQYATQAMSTKDLVCITGSAFLIAEMAAWARQYQRPIALTATQEQSTSLSSSSVQN